MPILKVKEKPTGDFELGDDGHISKDRVFSLLLSGGRVSDVEILADSRIPKQYTFHPVMSRALCVRQYIRRQGPGNKLAQVVCSYTSDFLNDVENPLERPADISWRDTEYVVAAIRDLDGKPFVSTSGEILEDVQIETPGEICTIVKNLPDMPRWFPEYRNVVNSGTVRIDGLTFGKGLCRIKSRQLSGWQNENEVDFRVLTLEIHIRGQGWQKQILNRGFYELAEKKTNKEVELSNGTKVKKIVTEVFRKQIMVDGRPAVEPQLLDINGKVIKFRDEKGEPIPEAQEKVKEAVLDFKIRGIKDFSRLPLK